MKWFRHEKADESECIIGAFRYKSAFLCHNRLRMPLVTSFQLNVSSFYFLMLDYSNCLHFMKDKMYVI